jgi:hypothetical protein
MRLRGRRVLTALLVVALVASNFPQAIVRFAQTAEWPAVSGIARAAVFIFLQECGVRTGPVGSFTGASSFEALTCKRPDDAALIMIALRDDFRRGQAIVSVVDSTSGAVYTAVGVIPLANGLTVGAYWHRTTPADGGTVVVNLAVPVNWNDGFAYAVARSYIVTNGGDLDAATSTSSQSPASPIVKSARFHTGR